MFTSDTINACLCTHYFGNMFSQIFNGENINVIWEFSLIADEMRRMTKKHNWASTWDFGTYHIGDQWRLRRACASTDSTQSRQSLHCSHTWSMEVDEGSDQKSDIWPHWMTAHARLKNEFTEDEKCHNLMSWLKSCIPFFRPLPRGQFQALLMWFSTLTLVHWRRTTLCLRWGELGNVWCSTVMTHGSNCFLITLSGVMEQHHSLSLTTQRFVIRHHKRLLDHSFC